MSSPVFGARERSQERSGAYAHGVAGRDSGQTDLDEVTRGMLCSGAANQRWRLLPCGEQGCRGTLPGDVRRRRAEPFPLGEPSESK